MTSSGESQTVASTGSRRGSSSAAEVVCLLRPPAVEAFRLSIGNVTLPLGLAYIAAALEAAGFTVHVVDAVALAPRHFTRYNRGYLVGLGFDDIIARIPPDATIVGISVIFTHEWPAVAQLVAQIKAARPTVRVMLGGEHVTSMPEFCLATSKADWLVLGEGEETAVELLRAHRHGDVSGVAGIAFRDGDDIIVSPRRARRKSVDDIAWPAWHLIDWRTYNACGYVGGIDVGAITFPILATRGCPYQCTFCSSPNMWTTAWIPRDPVKTVDEIEHYVTAYGARNFPFQDLTAIIKREWIIAFCQEIIRRRLEITWQFPSGTRSEAIDAEVAQLLYRSGMINMGYAPESGSDATRRLIKKKVKEERLLASIRAAVGAGLAVNVWIVLGFPHDTRESVRENLPFIDKIAELGVTDFGVSLYQALPGTEMFDSLYDAGRVRIDPLYFSHILQGSSIVPQVSHCGALSRAMLAFWKLRLSLRFYRATRAHAAGGLLPSLWRGARGIIRSGRHGSRFETAARNGWASAWATLKVRCRRGWMSRVGEAALMERWDDVYREIRRQNRERGVLPPMPADTAELHKTNVNARLKTVHSRVHRVRIAGRPLPPAPAAAVQELS
jgi:anaerobic magnesium-protoporphyrin IX monomethyl ester cyclase